MRGISIHTKLITEAKVRIKKIAVGCSLAASFMVLSGAAPAAVSVQSILSGNRDPVQSTNGDPVVNVDFTIFRADSTESPTIGDGIDERTAGLFDFRGDTNYSEFSSILAQTHGKISSALLTLVLTPRDVLYRNDQINLENGPFVGEIDPLNSEIGQLIGDNKVGVSTEITIDLLRYYSQTQLGNYLSFGSGDYAGDGRIRLTYADDAVVWGSSMILTASVPEPGALALLSAGLIPVLVGRKKRRERV